MTGDIASSHVPFGVGRASIRKNRFVSVGSDVPAGAMVRLTTQPLGALQFRHHLLLNCDVSVGGNLTVALLQAQDDVYLPGYSHAEAALVDGNHLAVPVTWAQQSVLPLNTTFRLEFMLYPPARIYALDLQ